MLKDKIDSVTQRIQNAFQSLPYPGDDNIVYPDTFRFNYDEGLRAFKSFKGKPWQEITLEALIANRDHLSFLTADAYRYYLPAYMIAVLRHFHKVDVLANNTYYSLTPPPKDDFWEEMFLSRAKGFNRSQQTAIREFLSLYAQLSPDSITDDPNHNLHRAIDFWESLDK
jgi:hypothetical protein